SDAERLLGMYQLWLDDLYPKARFGDALKMVEKVGHRKTMGVARRGWIEEGRPGRGGDEGGERGEGQQRGAEQAQREGTERIAPIFTDLASRAATHKPTTPPISGADVPDDDEDAIAELYGASPRAPKPTAQAQVGQGHTSIFGPRPAAPVATEEDEDEDDLAALLAEGGMDVDTPSATVAPKKAPVEDEFDDEMEAMAEMGW
ncbi:hypothetical protein V492_08063, partial [Pseudogymnoascus sp. VKM F-4246]